MNTKNNQRFQETELRIIEELLSLLEEKKATSITVSDLCKECNINRSTFYAHFQDIPELLTTIDSKLRKELSASFLTDDYKMIYASGDFLIPFLTFIKSHRTFYQACLATRTSFPIAQGYDSLMELVVRPLCKEAGITSERQIYYSLTYVQAGFTMVLKNWVDGGCKDSVEEIASYLKLNMHLPFQR